LPTSILIDGDPVLEDVGEPGQEKGKKKTTGEVLEKVKR
jgi:hypothetical protein